VEEGNQMACFENGSNAIGNLAFNACVTDTPEITWASIAAPDIHYQANPAKIHVNVGKVNFNVQPGKVQGDYQPGNVDIQVTKYPSIQFSTVDVKV
jgi:hypothetical protein